MPNSPASAERIAVLETKVNSIAETLESINGKLDLIDSPSGFPRSYHVWPAFGFLLVLLGAGFGYLDGSVIPRAITAQTETLKPRFDALDDRLKKLEGNVDTLNKKLGLTISIVGPANPETMREALNRETSADDTYLSQALPNVSNILEVVRNMHVRLWPQDYKQPSKRLFDHYVRAKEPEREKIWNVLLDMAKTKTTSDAQTVPVSQSQIDDAKASKVKNYFEDEEVDLTSRIAWQGTIFKNCKIRISNPNADLGLERVRFIACDFSTIPDDVRPSRIMESVVKSPTEKVNVAVPNFKVLRPYFRRISIQVDDKE